MCELLVLVPLLSLCTAAKLVDRPELLQLKCFPKSDGRAIDLATHIVDSTVFSACILEDTSGVVLAGIKAAFGLNPEAINNEIFLRWLQGKGRRPVQWRTLLHCLEMANLNELVKDIMTVMEESDGKVDFSDTSSQLLGSRRHDDFPIKEKTDLFSATNEVGNWESLCINLRVHDAIMERLKYSEREDILKKHECLTYYFKNNQPNWEDIVKVVADFPISNLHLACRIAKRYMLMDTQKCVSLYDHRDEL